MRWVYASGKCMTKRSPREHIELMSSILKLVIAFVIIRCKLYILPRGACLSSPSSIKTHSLHLRRSADNRRGHSPMRGSRTKQATPTHRKRGSLLSLNKTGPVFPSFLSPDRSVQQVDHAFGSYTEVDVLRLDEVCSTVYLCCLFKGTGKLYFLLLLLFL